MEANNYILSGLYEFQAAPKKKEKKSAPRPACEKQTLIKIHLWGI